MMPLIFSRLDSRYLPIRDDLVEIRVIANQETAVHFQSGNCRLMPNAAQY